MNVTPYPVSSSGTLPSGSLYVLASGNIQLTLPSASGTGNQVTIENVTSGGAYVTVSAAGMDVIEAVTMIGLFNQGDVFVLVDVGTGHWRIAQQPSVLAQLSYNGAITNPYSGSGSPEYSASWATSGSSADLTASTAFFTFWDNNKTMTIIGDSTSYTISQVNSSTDITIRGCPELRGF
jgi:hypothetical protein